MTSPEKISFRSSYNCKEDRVEYSEKLFMVESTPMSSISSQHAVHVHEYIYLVVNFFLLFFDREILGLASHLILCKFLSVASRCGFPSAMHILFYLCEVVFAWFSGAWLLH